MARQLTTWTTGHDTYLLINTVMAYYHRDYGPQYFKIRLPFNDKNGDMGLMIMRSVLSFMQITATHSEEKEQVLARNPS